MELVKKDIKPKLATREWLNSSTELIKYSLGEMLTFKGIGKLKLYYRN